MRIADVPAVATTDGWERIGEVCSAGRRSLWMRLHRRDEKSMWDDVDNIERIELCAGREGDDEYMVIERDNLQFEALLGMFLAARFAVQT